MARVCPDCGAHLLEVSDDFCSECFHPLEKGATLPLPDSNTAVQSVREYGQPEQHRVGMAIVCLRISLIPYLVIVALLCLLLLKIDISSELKRFAICLIFFCLALIFGIEQVVSGLRRRKFWAWVAGIIFFGLCLPSLYAPLGAFGLWGLLDEGSRAQFGIGGSRRRG